LRIKMYIVYVIKSFEGLTYIGQTNDINRRLKEHNKGLSRWTKRGADWELVYLEEYDNRQDAVQREKYLKSGAGREWLKRELSS